jgi:hypothetical protein
LQRYSSQSFDLEQPVALVPVSVAKSWGREIWYSGIEERGESSVRQGDTVAPLSDYLHLIGLDEVILLKELQAEKGDLYLEVHEAKREVYVAKTSCTLQLGMNQALRTELGDDDAFRQAFLEAANAYENNTASREAIDVFVSLRLLTQGDAVSIEPWMPHSLQRGANVIEFQTPVFERYILASTTPVETQQHWDTQQAFERILLDPYLPIPSSSLGEGVEQLVSTDSFGVLRVRGTAQLPKDVPYVIGIVTDGYADVQGTRFDGAFLARKLQFIDVSGEIILGGPGF